MITSSYWVNNERGSVLYDNRRLDDGIIKIGLKECFPTKLQDKYSGTLACPDILIWETTFFGRQTCE